MCGPREFIRLRATSKVPDLEKQIDFLIYRSRSRQKTTIHEVF